MKSNLLKSVLEWVIATGALLSIIFFVQFYFRTKELRTTQLQVARVQQSGQLLRMLVAETMEYSKANPDANLSRIMESVRAPGAPPNPTAK
jgi:hypothetical protein